HPGSLMFRETPAYIVAGEIVRTSRMYARSVSPLRRQMLGRISPILQEEFGGAEAVEGRAGAPPERGREKPREKARDFTNQIRIGSQAFPIRVGKGGRKMVTMEWEKLRPVLQEISPASLPSFKNVRGTILWDGREIFSTMKLGVILSLAPYLHTEEGVWEGWPAGRTFPSASSGRELCEHLPRLLCLCPLQKKSKRIGFLTLYTDWKGNYWFKPEKSLLTARTETLASLESLAEESGDALGPGDRETVNQLYHLISEMLEE
ncbi:MAG TPA: oligonucleotide/oligosaccharide-binding-fold domain-containing protein, partial [Spirochaetia bacterium]|nr:oligonucleotide/oligosaccharide-binding-fold domain-containing protein [Spirochaetia bacterium]